MPASNTPETPPASSRSRHRMVWLLSSLLLLGNVVGWWLALTARRGSVQSRCPVEEPAAPPMDGADHPPTPERGQSQERALTRPDFSACLRDPKVQEYLRKRLHEATRLGAAAGSDAARRADIEKAMQRRYDALERRERADRAALEQLGLDRQLGPSTRARLLEALERHNDDETESFLQWKEGKLTDQEHFAEIQAGSARLNEVFTNLVGAEGLTAYKKFWGTEYQKEMDQLDKEEGYP